MRSSDVEAASTAVRAAGFAWVSSGAVTLESPALGYGQALLVRDPDGHATDLVSP